MVICYLWVLVSYEEFRIKSYYANQSFKVWNQQTLRFIQVRFLYFTIVFVFILFFYLELILRWVIFLTKRLWWMIVNIFLSIFTFGRWYFVISSPEICNWMRNVALSFQILVFGGLSTTSKNTTLLLVYVMFALNFHIVVGIR